MIVVADTSPLNYLIQIECAHFLPRLYGKIIVPSGVLRELAHSGAPASVHAWLRQIPSWVDIGTPASPPDATLAFLGLGEREAIQLAWEQHADLLLIDERKGSLEAQRRGLRTTGTLGVLLALGELRFIEPLESYRRLLERTTFRSSPALAAHFFSKTASVSRYEVLQIPLSEPETGIRLPTLIVHCDWSTREDRRWMATAQLIDGSYLASAPELVGNLEDENQNDEPLLARIRQKRQGGAALVGFDFPIGLPKAYAGKSNIKDFRSFLRTLQPDSSFFQVCTCKKEISLNRPFYPNAPGGRQRRHLTDALGINFELLLRTCDRANEQRPRASALFWTLGANQVGKAAIVGWRDVLAPALRQQEIGIWPFHGTLATLLQPGKTVVAETYPTQYYSSIFGQLQGSKRSQQVRAQTAESILQWVADRATLLQLSPEVHREIQAGFNDGDDAFDAVIGLFGMIDAIQNYRPALEPADPTIRNIEGWILGQPHP